MAVALSCEGLWKIYEMGDEKIQAIKGVSLSINQGEMVAVMGPSGCGKTTLLNILSGIDDPSAGQVNVAGKPLFGISDDERSDIRGKEMGFIFQKFHLLDVMNAVENVEIPLLLAGTNPSDARKKATKALTKVGLSERVNHRPSELSGGQQQRVSIARAIVHDPSVILCDEPTGNLDSLTSKNVMELLLELNQSGSTIVIVTHDDDIASMCTRIVRIKDGSVVNEEE
ncbi:MAG: macrolide ABC transporter ATP-binding protein [Euryarchaeota archaeon]|nr:macrolide ABC transporter ATP-binding protein [Euryarchaeota archaeon]MBJ60911.1 macrolide ABC transporter ATP-binding protein [Euryarchaeota archaeon]|tara:strand:+ start:2005 stop:2685 length:681 start_codon:yes stop_codon:yes gene_type:complete